MNVRDSEIRSEIAQRVNKKERHLSDGKKEADTEKRQRRCLKEKKGKTNKAALLFTFHVSRRESTNRFESLDTKVLQKNVNADGIW